MPDAVYTIWWAGLIVTLVVFVPLAVYLLHRTWRAARSIQRYAAETLQAAGGIARNTANIAALDATIGVAGDMLAGRRRGGAQARHGRHRARRAVPVRRPRMLLTLTLITVALVVLALAGYLIAIAWALLDTRKSVAAIADGLEAVRGHTAPLPEKLTTINGALGALLGGLEAADRHLGRAATVFRLP